MINNLASPLCFTGNKTRILPLIQQNLPQGYVEFVDLFGGSGVVGLSQNRPVLYNEKDKYIYNLIKTIKDCDLDYMLSFIDFLIENNNLSKDNKQAYLNFRKMFNNNIDQLESERASMKESMYLRLLVLIFYSFNHYCTFNSSGKFNTPAGTHRSSYNKSIENKLITFKNRIDLFDYKFKMYNLDFRTMYKFVCGKYNDNLEDIVFFIDPPYLLSDNQYCRTYGNTWVEQDEIDLYNICNDINNKGGKFILTNLIESKGNVNEHLLTFSKQYDTINTNCDFGGCNYQRSNKKTDKEILVKNYYI